MTDEGGIIVRSRVCIPEQDGQRGAVRVSVVDARYDFRQVGFAPGRSACRPRTAAACEVGSEVLLREGNAGRHSVYRDAYRGAVRLSEKGYSETVPETVHAFVRMMESRSSQNRG